MGQRIKQKSEQRHIKGLQMMLLQQIQPQMEVTQDNASLLGRPRVRCYRGGASGTEMEMLAGNPKSMYISGDGDDQTHLAGNPKRKG
jgi:hypothetical protein